MMVFFFLLLLLLFPFIAFAQGNRTINVLPDSNKSTFRVDSQNFWKNELPNIMSRYVKEDFVVSGNNHSTSGSCTSGNIAFEGFTRAGNRVVVSGLPINYGASNIGGNCSNDVCWVVGSSQEMPTLPSSNFQRVGSSHVYVNCSSDNEPPWPDDAVKLMKTTLSGGEITHVMDIRQPSSFALNGSYDVTDPLYGGLCNGTAMTAEGIQRAIDAAPPGSKVSLPAGVCMLDQSINITKLIALEGKGINQTYLRQTVPSLPVVNFTGYSDIRLEKFTADHSEAPIEGGDGVVVNGLINHGFLSYIAAERNWRGFVLGCVAFGIAEHLQATQNNSNGFEFIYPSSTCGASQWQVHHALSQLNRGVGFGGFNNDVPVAIGPFILDAHSFGNTAGGYVFVGSEGHSMNDITLTNVMSSADNQAGIYMDTYGNAHIIANNWIELTGQVGGVTGFPTGFPPVTSTPSNSGNCVSLSRNNPPGLSVVGGYYWNCAWSSIGTDAPYSSIIGGMSLGAGLAADPNPSRRSHISIGASGVQVTGHTFNHAETGVQHYISFHDTIIQTAIGPNTYAPGISLPNIVESSGAIFSGTVPLAIVAGLQVHSGTLDAPGIVMYDASGFSPAIKILRVASGNFEILNSSASAVIAGVSDQGTPSWPSRRGRTTIADASTTANVPLDPAEPDTNYFVQVTAAGIPGGTPLPASFTVIGVNKLLTGFELVVLGQPGAGASVAFDWLVYR